MLDQFQTFQYIPLWLWIVLASVTIIISTLLYRLVEFEGINFGPLPTIRFRRRSDRPRGDANQRGSTASRDENATAAENEWLEKFQVFNMQSVHWLQFLREMRLYEHTLSGDLQAFFKEVERELPDIVRKPNVAFYVTPEWRDLKIAIENLGNYLPNAIEGQVNTAIIMNLIGLFKTTADELFQIRDWQGSRAVHELLLILRPNSPEITTKLQVIDQEIGKLEALKQTRYEILRHAIHEDDAPTIREILGWFSEIDSGYRDILKISKQYNGR